MSKRNPFDRKREVLRKLLVNARKTQGVTQTQLAKNLQKPQSFVSKYESGDRLIDLVETHQICQALGYSFNEFISSFDMAVNEPSIHYNKTQNDKD
ncbi:MAG: hypothetical protein Ctma_1042 [Catillopecten margaritatus gill symbiont]|uniref:HTH cro/C1-type domain-containing protein n=1 Tax=Catillopecten margaritatus gill symbiont TaxID=3083288 RepID=A0AAU6PH50_9GAMM